jgi:cytochrome oxidase assembly protein ShyY1
VVGAVMLLVVLVLVRWQMAVLKWHLVEVRILV